MMVLIVEDDVNKLKQLAQCITELLPEAVVVERRSYQGGLASLMTETPALVVLDMTMPTYDPEGPEKGGRLRKFGGRDILLEMRRKKMSSRVVVVTQFDVFGEGEDQVTLEELDTQLKREFPALYLGRVYYHPSQSDWKHRLQTILAAAGT